MSKERIFLGWDEPLVGLVSTFLLENASKINPFDLRTTCIVVPTRHAGRRLRERLALDARARGTALLAPSVVTPSALFRPETVENAANDLQLHGLLVDVFSSIDPNILESLFPSAFRDSGLPWQVAAAKVFQSVRSTLQEDGYDLHRFFEAHQDPLHEKKRWKLLVFLEKALRERLREANLSDPVQAQLNQAENPQLKPEITHLILAGTPDPSVPALRALDGLAKTLPTTILIHAPQHEADLFDDWGRPKVERWTQRAMPLPEHVLVGGSLEGQMDCLLDGLAKTDDRYGSRDISILVPDSRYLEPIQTRLKTAKLEGFDPSGIPASRHPVFHVLRGFLNLAVKDDWRSFSALARHADVVDWLEQAHEIDPVTWCIELDNAQSNAFPIVFSNWAEYRLHADTLLSKGLAAIVGEIQSFKNADDVSTAITNICATIYGHRQLGTLAAEDDAFRQVARSLTQAGRKWMESGVELPLLEAMQLVLSLFSSESYYLERSDHALALEGWLEIHWSPSPCLFLTGFHEGIVPDTRIDDPFLPETLRESLGMISDARRYARDAFLYEAALHAREAEGGLTIIQGRQGPDQSPLKPSRILLNAPEDQQLQRSRQLFLNPAYEPDRPPNLDAGVKLTPQSARLIRPPTGDDCRIRITGIKNYLTCPFHYFLFNVLNMEPLDAAKTELSALDFGSLIHRVLERLTAADLAGVDDEGALTDALHDEAQNQIQQIFGSLRTIALNVQMDAALQRLRWVARHEARLRSEGWETILTEKNAQYPIEGVVLSGRIDRIDRHRESGAIRVIDYKTSARPAKPTAAHLINFKDEKHAWRQSHDPKKMWADVQLPLYAAMLQDHPQVKDRPIDVGYFNIPRSVRETSFIVWPGFDRECMQSAVDVAGEAVRRIRDWQFWPPNEVNMPRSLDAQMPGWVDELIDGDGFDAWLGHQRAKGGGDA